GARRTRCARAPPSWVDEGASGGTHRRAVPTEPWSQRAEESIELERRDLVAVARPFLPLVPEEEVEHLLAQGRGHQLAVLHERDRVIEALGQRPDAQCASLRVREPPDVVLGLLRQRQLLLDPLEPRREHE